MCDVTAVFTRGYCDVKPLRLCWASAEAETRGQTEVRRGRAAEWRSPWAGATAAPSLPSCLLPRLSSVCKQINLTSSLSVPTLSLLFSR